MAVSSVKGCVSVAQERNSYSQNAELRWDNRSVKQGLKYQVLCRLTLLYILYILYADGWCLCLCVVSQRGPRGMHSLQVNVGLDKVSPAPCPSHTLLTKLQTNLRDRLEHTVLLGLCPPQPVSPHTCILCFSHAVIYSLGFSPIFENILVEIVAAVLI